MSWLGAGPRPRAIGREGLDRVAASGPAGPGPGNLARGLLTTGSYSVRRISGTARIMNTSVVMTRLIGTMGGSLR
jgi:hypothetical protein